MNKQQAIQIISFRTKDNKKLQQKKKDFLNWLTASCLDYEIQTKEDEGKFREVTCYNPKLKHFEMWNCNNGEPLKTKEEYSQFINGKANTRTKINSETCLEIDKLKFDKAVAVICETIMSLIRNKYHFFLWYAEGQRSPHIRIYDFEELEQLNPQQRIKLQVAFWRKHVPFGCFQYVDTGIFCDDHTLQLEYAIHWKYGTPFNLLFEHKPEVKPCKN